MSRKSKPTASVTSDIDVTFGAFERGNFRVPYMSAVMNTRNIKDWIQLVTEDSKFADQDWSIEELYQRDLDQHRVLQIARQYLGDKQNNRPAFFNSITVVLMKKDLPAGDYVAPPKLSGFDETEELGPIRISFERYAPGGKKYPDSCSFGTLSWNRNQVRAVAIDGQHRLAALKEYFSINSDEAEKTSISVLFLIIDEKLGFIAPSFSKTDQVKYMRSIFIDLNKHAVPVSRSRNILLDDRDPQALMLKNIIGPSLNYSPTRKNNRWGLKKGHQGEFDENIPLSLVDWHGETRSKIDSGPYISSILSLDWIVRKVLSSSTYPPQKLLDFSKFSIDDDDYYTKVRKVLRDWRGVWKVCESELLAAEKANSQFFFSEASLVAASNEFTKLWGYPILRVLTELTPYIELVRIRIKSKTLSAQFPQWYQAIEQYSIHKKRDNAVAAHYKKNLHDIETTLREAGQDITAFQQTIKDCENLKKTYGIPYYLVGQRALVFALIKQVATNNAATWASTIGADIHKFSYSPNDFYAHFFVEALNSIEKNLRLKSKSIFKKNVPFHSGAGILGDLSNNLWAGSICKRDKTDEIDYSEKAAIRGSKIFLLLTYLYWFKKLNPGVIAKDVVDAIHDPNSISTYKFAKEVTIGINDVKGEVGKDNYDNPFGYHVNRLEDNASQSHLDQLIGVFLTWFYKNC